MNNVLPLKPRKDARDTFEAKREKWKSELVEQEPFDHPLWWKCAAIMGLMWFFLLLGIYWGFHS